MLEMVKKLGRAREYAAKDPRCVLRTRRMGRAQKTHHAAAPGLMGFAPLYPSYEGAISGYRVGTGFSPR
jgi:hypothetical protein